MKSVFFLLFLAMGPLEDATCQSFCTEEGKASYYGSRFHGSQTANGETFNMNELTAAHPTLPFNTLVKVTNLHNNHAVILRINDRGPFSKARIIDVSKAAATQLDMIKNGVAKVRVELIEEIEHYYRKNVILPPLKRKGLFTNKNEDRHK